MYLTSFKVDTWMDWEPIEIYIYILHGRLLLIFFKINYFRFENDEVLKIIIL